MLGTKEGKQRHMAEGEFPQKYHRNGQRKEEGCNIRIGIVRIHARASDAPLNRQVAVEEVERGREEGADRPERPPRPTDRPTD